MSLLAMHPPHLCSPKATLVRLCQRRRCRGIDTCTRRLQLTCHGTLVQTSIEGADDVLLRSHLSDVLTAKCCFLFGTDGRNSNTAGTDIAIEAADYVLMKSDLGDVLTALDLSAKTFRRIRLNYCWAFGYNTLMIPLAAGVLYPSTQWQMPPWVAGDINSILLLRSRCATLLSASLLYHPVTAALRGERSPSGLWIQCCMKTVTCHGLHDRCMVPPMSCWRVMPGGFRASFPAAARSKAFCETLKFTTQWAPSGKNISLSPS